MALENRMSQMDLAESFDHNSDISGMNLFLGQIPAFAFPTIRTMIKFFQHKHIKNIIG